MINSRLRLGLLTGLVYGFVAAAPAAAQSLVVPQALNPSLLSTEADGFNVTRNAVQTPFSSEYISNLNLGMVFSPVKGLDLRADAWRVDVQGQMPAAAVMPEVLVSASMPGGLFIDDSNLYAGMLEAPSVKSTVTPGQQAYGIDLSASYVWESPRFGQFIVSTKSTYLYDTATPGSVLDSALVPVTENTLLPRGTDLQSSLMLTWQIGNHTASAITHYFDSFEEIGNLNLEQLNELVGNLTTLDLQYGYNLKAGKQGQAVFSLGVRNLFDSRPDQLQERRAGAIEQSGRVAYGTIKYQF
ncbi:MAG: TonB-dependent receptor [Gammaproteobacteria bacterium]|nr:TonB-dependent receptor [Gammaproteobacteria bacterium]MDP2139880.1 TonB-dependent receptor [Gammaproteobacteria bacterium]MDP2347700.1 TonB-dependent receptor [Gammaproteobacteria bacterium]